MSRQTDPYEYAANEMAYRQYLRELSQDRRDFRRAFREEFFRAMREQLTARQYQVLWLHEVEGHAGNEIAARLGISPSAVSRHLTRGKRRLRVLLSYNLELHALPDNA